MTPVGFGRSVSPIPIPKQVVATGLDVDQPESFGEPLLSRVELTKIDKFQFKPTKHFPFFLPLTGSGAAHPFFECLEPSEVLDDQFTTITEGEVYGHGYTTNTADQTQRASSVVPDYFDLIFPLLQPPLRIGATKSVPLPANLREYQWVGVLKLITNPAFLIADEMGLGKTIIVCVALRMLFRQAQLNRSIAGA